MKARQSDLVLTTVRLVARRDRTFGVPIRHLKKRLLALDTTVAIIVHLATLREVQPTLEVEGKTSEIAILAQASITLLIVFSQPRIALLESERHVAQTSGRRRRRVTCQDLVFTSMMLELSVSQ